MPSADGSASVLKVEPLTSFAMGRFSRDFGDGRSAIGAIVTGVDRSEMTPALAAVLPGRALAVGLNGRHRFRADAYEATGFFVASHVEGTPAALRGILEGPGHYFQGSEGDALSGFAAQARLARIGGEHWRWTLAAHAMSPRLELNDLGFQRNADWRVAVGSLTYQEEKPGRWLRRWAVGSSQVGAGWSFAGDRRAAVLNLTANADLRNFWGGALAWDHEWPALQTEALRGGPPLLVPGRDAFSLSTYSDTRRVSQGTLDLRAFREPSTGSHQLYVAPSLSLRPQDRLALSLGPSLSWTTNRWQFAGTASSDSGPRYVLGRLAQETVALTLRADLAFSSRLTLQLYAQPFASRGQFDAFQEVVAPRAARVDDRLRPLAGELPVPDPSYRVRDLRANLVLRWEYRPGSALFVVWTQARHDGTGADFGSPVRELWDAFRPPADNKVLLKVSYWFAPRRRRS